MLAFEARVAEYMGKQHGVMVNSGSSALMIAMKLANLPRNSSATRLHNRCQLTGRPHAYYRKLKVSRIMLRELGSQGQIPGLVKSSW